MGCELTITFQSRLLPNMLSVLFSQDLQYNQIINIVMLYL